MCYLSFTIRILIKPKIALPFISLSVWFPILCREPKGENPRPWYISLRICLPGKRYHPKMCLGLHPFRNKTGMFTQHLLTLAGCGGSWPVPPVFTSHKHSSFSSVQRLWPWYAGMEVVLLSYSSAFTIKNKKKLPWSYSLMLSSGQL